MEKFKEAIIIEHHWNEYFIPWWEVLVKSPLKIEYLLFKLQICNP
jgi:hypothetical protein